MTLRTAPKRRACSATWRRYVRGDVFRLRAPREARSHEQAGASYAVVVQSDALPLSTWLVAPTYNSAKAATFRPEIKIRGGTTRVLTEHTVAIAPHRLGEQAGALSFDELRRVDVALRIVLAL